MRSPLDTVTKSSSPPSQTGLFLPPNLDLDTGELIPSYDPLVKWELQAISKMILAKGKLNRICKCCKFIRPDYLRDKKAIEIRGGLERKPYYVGLMVCGKIWVCPVCSAKIQAYRALQVRKAIDAHVAQGGSVWMVTQTVPHTKFDVLEDILEMFAKSFHSFKSGKKWVAIKDFFNISGYIKALEVTWGSEYGWHPHLHTIFFLDESQENVDLKGLQSQMFAQWSKVTSRRGFGQLSEQAFTIQDASKVKDYLNKMTGERYKWGSESELVKLHTKRAKGKSFAPYDFLRAYMDNPKDLYVSLFKTFANAFHGKQHLVWSRGLKVRYSIDSLTDEEVAASIGEKDALLAFIDPTQWKQLKKLPCPRWRGELLDCVRDFGQEGLKHFLESKGIWSALD